MKSLRSIRTNPRCPHLPPEALADCVAALSELENGYEGYDISLFLKRLLQDANVREAVYALLTRTIRSLAAREDLSGRDAYVVEACRKICDVMGWAPAKEAA